MPATLRVSPALAEAFDLNIRNTATIGRTRDNTVCLTGSLLVSRQHALIRCHNGYQYQIIDLGSRNGTYVNDRRVITPVTLEHGAKIRVADNAITFEQDEEDFSSDHLDITVAGTEEETAGSAVQPVALLVCDIRSFSTMAEKIPSDELARVLGAWFRQAGNIVCDSGGTVDKFIGDAMLAYWSGCGGPTVDCERVAAIARKLLALAETMQWPNGDALRVGVALHYGHVTCGNVGIDAQRDATIIGDAVNTVFRLESVMKDLHQRLVLSHDFLERMGEKQDYVDLGEHSLKGKRHPMRIAGLA